MLTKENNKIIIKHIILIVLILLIFSTISFSVNAKACIVTLDTGETVSVGKIKGLKDKIGDTLKDLKKKATNIMRDKAQLNVKKEIQVPEFPLKVVKIPEVNPETVNFIKEYKPVLKKTQNKLNNLFKGKTIGGRLKDPLSLEGKIKSKIEKGKIKSADDVLGYTGQAKDAPIQDIAGTRVTFDSLDEEKKATKDIEKNFEVISIDDYVKNPKKDGYRAIHYVVEVDGKPVEIQLRTPRQTKWADWSHDTCYKGSMCPEGSPTYKYSLDMANYFAKLDIGKPAVMPKCPPAVKQKNICF